MADGFDGFSGAEEIAITTAPTGDIERAALACVLADEGEAHVALARMRDLFGAGDLAGAHHATIWNAYLAVKDRGDVLDVSIVGHELEATGHKDAASYLFAKVALTEVHPAHCEAYARKVREHAHLRAVRASVGAAYQKLQGKGAPLDVLAQGRAALAEVPDDFDASRDDSLGGACKEAIDEMEDAVKARREGKVVCAKWGIPALDGYPIGEKNWEEGALGGLAGSRLYLVGGVPEAGKTSLAWSAVLATARDVGRVLVFSLEMSRVDLAKRLMIQMHNRDVGDPARFISENRMERGALNRDERASLSRAHIKLSKLPVVLVEDCRTFDEIRARTLAEHARSPLALVVVDFLQLVEMGRRSRDPLQDDKERAYGMKTKIVNVIRAPMIAITSMSKGAQNRATKDNEVDVTSASGDALVAYAADVMAFLVRTDPKDESASPEVLFAITKRRGGLKQPVTLRFHRPYGVFESVEGVGDREERREHEAAEHDLINADGGDA